MVDCTKEMQAKQKTEKQRTTESEEPQRAKRKKIKVRLIPIWLRLIIITFLLLLSFVIGVVGGYSMLGDGKMTDAFKKSTWQHIVDLVKKD